MTAKNMTQCDRCKKVFDMEQARSSSDSITIHRHHDTKMDFCENCTVAFRHFINYPERDEQSR